MVWFRNHQCSTNQTARVMLKVREVIRIVERDGWYYVRTRGSHHQFRHPNKARAIASKLDIAGGTE